MVFGDAKASHTHHATPAPDGKHYIIGMTICKVDSHATEIVGLYVTTASVDGSIMKQDAQGYVKGVCSESFLLPIDDCVQYFNIGFDDAKAAVKFEYSTRSDPDIIRSIGYAEGMVDSTRAVNFKGNSCMVSMDVGFAGED